MAQQTQIATVLPYYTRFMKRFPTVRALARADIDEVLPYWAGLGYYRRCHNLHAAVRMIADEFNGHWPRDVEALQTLPGVGRYTAGAIASIAFGLATPAVDGNVKRVLTRLLGLDAAPESPAALEQIWSAAAALVAPRRPGEFNQGLMEIGSRICRPRQPNCPRCPLKTCCNFALNGGPDPLRRSAKRTKITEVTLVTVAVQRDGKLLYRRRPNHGLWAGLWEWPTEWVRRSERPIQVATRLLEQVSPCNTGRITPFHTMTHQLSHRLITFHAYRVVIDAAEPRTAQERWVQWERKPALPLSAAQSRLLVALRSIRSASNALSPAK